MRRPDPGRGSYGVRCLLGLCIRLAERLGRLGLLWDEGLTSSQAPVPWPGVTVAAVARQAPGRCVPRFPFPVVGGSTGEQEPVGVAAPPTSPSAFASATSRRSAWPTCAASRTSAGESKTAPTCSSSATPPPARTGRNRRRAGQPRTDRLGRDDRRRPRPVRSADPACRLAVTLPGTRIAVAASPPCP